MLGKGHWVWNSVCVSPECKVTFDHLGLCVMTNDMKIVIPVNSFAEYLMHPLEGGRLMQEVFTGVGKTNNESFQSSSKFIHTWTWS